VTLVIALFARRAAAHELDLSQGRYTLDGATLRASLVFAAPDVASAFPGGDAGLAVVSGLRVRGDGTPCPAALDGVQAIEGDATRIDAHFSCGAAPAVVDLDFDFLDHFTPGHRHIVTFGARAPELVTRSAPHLVVAAGVALRGSATEGGSFVAMLRTGVEHILTGYDHLAFLLALVLVGGRPRALVAVVTAFTVAHSLTLGLAALHVFTPSPRVVEPVIALSIAYVAVENFFVKDASRRWRVTFPFGLVHGFGFASALAAIDLPRERIPVALLAFNLGVEIGQLAVLGVLAAPLYFLRKSAWFRDRGVRIASAMLAGAGLVLFVRRLIVPP